ncbi:hypothetical protein KC332_g17052 [Hortaea werneckii]|uniref:Zn(2)-C6 fungal-type domain-containing protein n=2 Tax=Hortaea werneckii TaxID=91943 RepID=A0A3M7I3S3_HORWE|nr:hypothetical protein KC358_g17443 [Hortaea werneckii]OTA25893.1 hypothetical protein BTJ68_12258 [Hortaea werneckii EXF-2000]KAI6809532.1 hypothetical protein KC350_g12908 [Hortaea werneckii]KAI6816793.1 hypothetical protein KC342_g15301 [Hortaea werneckii]KAI6899543.1 hypothetical protein KC348_g17110 [Hortaea werneckii]
MPGSEDAAAGEDYFNDLSQQPPTQHVGNNAQVPKPKRIACVLCRKRKLKCDGEKPACGTCSRLQHDCAYDEVRRKSGPKRGYVKALEARLQQVETLLKTQDDQPSGQSDRNGNRDSNTGDQTREVDSQPLQYGNMVPDFPNIAGGFDNTDILPQNFISDTDTFEPMSQDQYIDTSFGGMGSANNNNNNNLDMPSDESFPWEMISLGLDEPMPPQDVIDELNQAYFDKIHPTLPMIHKPRYYAALNLAPNMRPPVCLRYAMWASAASVTDKYQDLQQHFYQRARKYIQQDEMKGHGESMISVAHCQTWVILATYEFKLMYFPRAWMSAGRACRMGLMMGLHRVDGVGLDVKQCLPPPKDFVELEERRRTFWGCFCVDRYSSIGTGWPMVIDEKDIMSVLPANEDAYLLGKAENTLTLAEALSPDGTPYLSSFAGVVVLGCLFGRNLTHLHRPDLGEREDDLNGEFWKRHRSMDNILLNIALALPDRLRLPMGISNPNVVFTNMSIHTSTICLHQAAIFKAEKNRMNARVSQESKIRCITAASETASIMRQISHIDVSLMNPFMSFCLYVAARVFVQYLKPRPDDVQVRSSLQFLLQAMNAIKRKNPLTESFLVQLDVDMEAAGLGSARPRNDRSTSNRGPGYPQTHQTMKSTHDGCGPTYGDQGLSKYADPNSDAAAGSRSNAAQEAFGYGSQDSTSPPFQLPDRRKTPAGFTPGAIPGGALLRSPEGGMIFDLGNSPEGSSGRGSSGDNNNNNNIRTPSLSSGGSSQNRNNSSSHTSQTGYSPPEQERQNSDPGCMGMLFAGNTDAFVEGFETTTTMTGQFPPSAKTGFTPGPTGMTPGSSSAAAAGGGAQDFMSMTDADWNRIMDGMAGWEAGATHELSMSG